MTKELAESGKGRTILCSFETATDITMHVVYQSDNPL